MPERRCFRHVRIGGQVDLQRRYGNETCAAFTEIRSLFFVGNLAYRAYPISLFAARIARGNDVLTVMPPAQTGDFNAPHIFRLDGGDIDVPQNRDCGGF